MLQTTHSFNAANGSEECSTITIVQREIPSRFLGHYGIAMFHDPDRIWVKANVRETDIGALKPGMRAEIRVDAYRGKVFGGEVFRIGQAATNKFALLPDPNPSGNFTKITRRLPVRITLTEKDHALRPGMMVEVDIGLRNR